MRVMLRAGSRGEGAARRALVVTLVVPPVVMLGACATGTTTDEGFAQLGGGGDDGAGGESGGPSGTGIFATSTAGSGGDGGGGSGGGAGGAGASGAGGSGGCSYASPNTCASAQTLGVIAGDKSGNPVVVTGNTSKWFLIKVEEQVSSIGGVDLSYTVSLATPAGMDFDLYVLPGPEGGDPSCAAAPVKGTGTPESVSDKWDDDQPLGGEDDSKWLDIEVRYVSGTLCGAAAEWTLTIEGKT
jgi:hypothetical protein